jgi:hypothetical protein
MTVFCPGRGCKAYTLSNFAYGEHNIADRWKTNGVVDPKGDECSANNISKIVSLEFEN